MSYQPRMITTYEKADASIVMTLGLADYQWQSDQPLFAPSSKAVGADYIHDYLGAGPSQKDAGREQLRFVIMEDAPSDVDTQLDATAAALVNIGLGKLYQTDSTGTRRWCWARAVAMPAVTWNAGDIFQKTVFVDFRRQSDWYSTTLSTYTTTVTAGQSPKSVTWNNPGTAKMRLTITAVALASGGYSAGFTIKNSTPWVTPLGEMTTSRVSASTSSRVEYDGPRQRVRNSTDAGVTYADDYASVTLPDVQPDFAIDLAPGDNTVIFTVGGTPNVQFNASGYPAYHS